MNVGVMEDYKLRDLRASHTLGRSWNWDFHLLHFFEKRKKILKVSRTCSSWLLDMNTPGTPARRLTTATGSRTMSRVDKLRPQKQIDSHAGDMAAEVSVILVCLAVPAQRSLASRQGVWPCRRQSVL